MLNKRTFSGNTVNTTARGRGIQYRPVVVIAANTDYRLMEAIRERVGVGQVYEHQVSNTRKSYNPRKRRQWTYRLNVGQIPGVLDPVRPWLVLKGEQADLLREAMRIKAGYWPGTTDLTEYQTSLDGIYEQIRALNTRGRELPVEQP